MSKMDELRALREARYEQTLARAAAHRAGTAGTSTARSGPTRTSTARTGTRPTGTDSASEPVESPSTEVPGAEARLCGHRAISGRTCTREHGHSAKSHRYS